MVCFHISSHCTDILIRRRIAVNGKIVKPSYEVKIGDIVEIKFGDKISKFEIIQIPQKEGKNQEETIKINQKRTKNTMI